MLSGKVDNYLARVGAGRSRNSVLGAMATRSVPTPAGHVRLYDSGSTKPCVILVPDGPNVIEHYKGLLDDLSLRYRVVCFDMPGFGHSLPAETYGHSLDEGASVVLAVLDALNVDRATLSFSCANGFYALRVAQLAPRRVDALVLSQTPSLAAMQAWSKRVIPRALHIPVVGQTAGWLLRRQAAGRWYRIALPAGRDTSSMQIPAMAALADGGCFCLAGVVRGLGREKEDSLRGIVVPCVMAWGVLDRSHKFTHRDSLKLLLPHACVVEFARSGHLPDLEEPHRFAALVDDAVSAASAARA